MAHIRIWKFRPPAGREDEFARAYAGDGRWARLFETAEGFLATELLPPADPGEPWLTIDRWRSRDAFEAFQRESGAEYQALDAELEGVAGEEEFVGAFGSDGG
jgi:heme-degrading monooxygenase HmoA